MNPSAVAWPNLVSVAEAYYMRSSSVNGWKILSQYDYHNHNKEDRTKTPVTVSRCILRWTCIPV